MLIEVHAFFFVLTKMPKFGNGFGKFRGISRPVNKKKIISSKNIFSLYILFSYFGSMLLSCIHFAKRVPKYNDKMLHINFDYSRPIIKLITCPK